MPTLKKPDIKLVPSYLAFIEEMRQCGEKIWEEIIPFPDESSLEFIGRLESYETNPPGHRVPETTYWAMIGGDVVGRISLRHLLNENLRKFGGHIGYEVRPSFRNRGVAKAMLGLVLKTPTAQKIGHLLLTCAPDNIASNKTILANGGVLKETRFVEKWQRDTNYYWIELGKD